MWFKNEELTFILQVLQYTEYSTDFIFGPKMILSGFLDLTNDKVYSDSVNKLGLRLIYDIDNDFSVAGGLVYSDSAVSVHASGGYQFKDVSAGNLKMNFSFPFDSVEVLEPQYQVIFKTGQFERKLVAIHRTHRKLQTCTIYQ